MYLLNFPYSVKTMGKHLLLIFEGFKGKGVDFLLIPPNKKGLIIMAKSLYPKKPKEPIYLKINWISIFTSFIITVIILGCGILLQDPIL